MTEVTSTVRMKHIRAAKICSAGARTWWESEGLDWTDFLRNGIPVERLKATGDPRALRVAAIAEADQGE
jgi:hypothetical protein